MTSGRKLVFVLFVILGIFGFSLREEKDEAQMDSMLLHQPIQMGQIASMHAWTRGHTLQEVPFPQQRVIVDAFNRYPSTRVAEEQPPNTVAARLEITFLPPHESMLIHYTDNRIVVERAYYSYLLLDEAPELSHFFRYLAEEEATRTEATAPNSAPPHE